MEGGREGEEKKEGGREWARRKGDGNGFTGPT